jgi:hypothetical protein
VQSLPIRHKVDDYERWKQLFDGDAELRLAHGSGCARVFRNDSEPDEVWLLLEWDDLARARLFARSEDLVDFMNRAGIADHPDYWYLEEPGSP